MILFIIDYVKETLSLFAKHLLCNKDWVSMLISSVECFSQ